jgi:DNA-binding transcriptional LysR family regulator
LVFDDDMLMIQAARDGAGIAYVYEAMVREEVNAGRLVSVLDSFSAPPGRFSSTTPDGGICRPRCGPLSILFAINSRHRFKHTQMPEEKAIGQS